MKIAFLFTCYNRIDKTRRCIETISKAIEYAEKNFFKDESIVTKDKNIEAIWYVTDAGSKDGTLEILNEWSDKYEMHTCVENDVYYSQGMRVCLNMAMASEKCDYYILINDDVEFYVDFLYKMINMVADKEEHAEYGNCMSVIVGATDDGKRQTYGGIRYQKGVPKCNHLALRKIRYEMVKTDDVNRKCHTFNANCVLISGEIFQKSGLMDEKYVHSLGDFDYGMRIYEQNGEVIQSTDFFVGKCLNNSQTGTWMDNSLGRIDRIKRLNSTKGSPTNLWFHYLYKHFGLVTACVYSISPYVRIMLGK